MQLNKKNVNLLIVDDSPEILRLLTDAFAFEGYRVRVAPDGAMAIDMALLEIPDLVLLDIDIPGLNGYEVCDFFKANPKLVEIPIIFLSAINNTNSKITAFERGGVDYVTKPIILKEILARVATHVQLNQLQKMLEIRNKNLARAVADQVHELFQAQLSTIFALVKLVESRDKVTGLHIDKVSHLSKLFAKAIINLPHFSYQLDDQYIDTIHRASALHDVGKIAIDDAILQKNGKLNVEDFEIMKRHSVIGYEALSEVLKNFPDNQMLLMGADISRYHHERWNGTGYPDGLEGREIPLSARIVAIADVYDALRATRQYKPPLSHVESIEIIRNGSGVHFDPELVGVLNTMHNEFDRVWQGFHQKVT